MGRDSEAEEILTPGPITLEAEALEKELGAQLDLAEGVFPIEAGVIIKTAHSLTEAKALPLVPFATQVQAGQSQSYFGKASLS